MTGRILALDLGASLGWASRSPSGLITSGVEHFHTGGRHGYGLRFLEFRRWLGAWQGSHFAPERVFCEDVRRHVSCASAHAYGGFLAELAAWCEQHDVPYNGIGVGVWKRRIIGNGAADKDMVLANIRGRGYEPADHNEADALALLLYVLRDPGADPPARVKRKPKRKPGHRPKRAAPAASAELPFVPLVDDGPF